MNNPNAITLTESEHTLRLRIIGAKSPPVWEWIKAEYLTEPHGGSLANAWYSAPGPFSDLAYSWEREFNDRS